VVGQVWEARVTTLLEPRTGAPDRFTVPLYSVAEAARYLAIPPSTLSSWATGYTRPARGHRKAVATPAVLTSIPRAGAGRAPVIPFVGLAEGVVLAAIRSSGVSLQRIRPALTRLEAEIGLEHALASQRLFTDGAEVLFDYAEHGADADTESAVRELVVVRNGQSVFNPVVEAYLQRVDFAADGYARLIRLPAYTVADVVVDPGRGFGQPIFSHGGARLEDALAMFEAGEPLSVVAAEYDVPPEQLEDAIRVALRPAA
jgi:uncharacterized protein (DUF433 family)